MVTLAPDHPTPLLSSLAHSRTPSVPHSAHPPPSTIHPPSHSNATPGPSAFPPPLPIEHVIPTYYPYGGQSYLWEGKGIFVDPHTGMGLSLWVDQSLPDAMEIIRRIWGEGGHISPFHDNAVTQLLIINAKSSLIRDTYCHPSHLPSSRRRQSQPSAPSSNSTSTPITSHPVPTAGYPPYEEPWQHKVMLDSAWVELCCRHGQFMGEPNGWAGCRIGGPVNVTTMPYPPMARWKGLEAREMRDEGIPLTAESSFVPMGVSVAQPQAPGSGAGGEQGKANGQATNSHSHHRAPGHAVPATAPVSQNHHRVAPNNAPVPSTKPYLAAADERYPKRASQTPTSPKASRKKRGPNKKLGSSRPSTLSNPRAAAAAAANALGDDSESTLTSINSSDEEDDELSEEEDAESVLELGGPADGDGANGGRLFRKVTNKGATLEEIAEVFRIERLAFGPGVRDSYFVAQLKKKYNTYSQATWRDLYLSYLYQEGQFAYLKLGGGGGFDKPIPVEDLEDPELPSSKRRKLESTSAAARYLNSSTLSWADVSLAFEKESQAIGAAGLNMKEAGEFFAEKYGVYIASTWTAYFTRWHKLKAGQTIEKASPPHRPPQPRQNGTHTTGHSRARTPPQPQPQQRARAPPSESESEDEDDEVVVQKRPRGREEKRGAVEFMTNDRIVSIFKHVKPKFEKQQLSRAEIAEALEARYGVYTTSSWSLYWSSWKAGRGRFARQASAANKPFSRRKGGAPARLPTPPPKVRRAPPTARQSLAKKGVKHVRTKHSFTEEEEKAMAAYVVQTGQDTVLPSYLTWQGWAKDTAGFPVRTPSSYATHCWKFRDRMEQLVAEAKGLPVGKPWHGELKKRGPGRGSDSEGEDDGDEDEDEDIELESEGEGGGPEVQAGEEVEEDSEGEDGEGGSVGEVEMEEEEVAEDMVDV